MARIHRSSTLQAELGSLDRISRIVKVFGMVNVAPLATSQYISRKIAIASGIARRGSTSPG